MIETPKLKAKRAYAKSLGIPPDDRIGEEKLDQLIQEKLSGQKMQNQETSEETPNETLELKTEDYGFTLAPGEPLFYTEEEYQEREAAESRGGVNRLVRCRITCMNPNKKNWTGEIISVGSSKLGTFKKFIPYNSDQPYHIPQIIFNYLKERKCRIGITTKAPDGREINTYKLVNEFAIETLPTLTENELKDLAQRQAMAVGV